MQKLEKSHSETFTFVRLYLEDFYSIIEILTNSCKKVSIEINNYRLDGSEASDIRNMGQGRRVINDLKIHGYDPYVSLDFDKFETGLYISNSEDIKSSGIFSKIKEIIIQSQSPLRYIYNFKFLFIAPAVASLIIGLIPNYQLFKYTKIGWYSFLVFYSIGYFKWIFKQNSFLLLSEKIGKSNFFERKKDDLILSFISGLIGASLGVFGTLLTQWISKK